MCLTAAEGNQGCERQPGGPAGALEAGEGCPGAAGHPAAPLLPGAGSPEHGAVHAGGQLRVALLEANGTWHPCHTLQTEILDEF